MPKPSPQAHLPYLDTGKTSACLMRLSRRNIISAPNNQVIGRKMSTRKLLESLPKRQRDAGRDLYSECRVRARRVHSRRDGHLMVVFKRTGSGRNKSPCGMSNCSRCGVFWRMYTENLERAVPGLVSEQPRPLEKRKHLPTFGVPSTPGSSMSTLTELTEDLEILNDSSAQAHETGSPVPSTTSSSLVEHTLKHDKTNAQSCASPLSTVAIPTEDKHTYKSSFPPILTSLSTLIDFDELGTALPLSTTPFPVKPTLHGFPEVEISSISTLTEFSELDTTSTLSPPPSNMSSLSTLSTFTTIPPPPKPQHNHHTESHKNMITMSDGSEWLPPTLERVQAYIISQGSRRLARSARSVVFKKAGGGSRVARSYERGILRVDLRVAKKRDD